MSLFYVWGNGEKARIQHQPNFWILFLTTFTLLPFGRPGTPIIDLNKVVINKFFALAMGSEFHCLTFSWYKLHDDFLLNTDGQHLDSDFNSYNLTQ